MKILTIWRKDLPCPCISMSFQWFFCLWPFYGDFGQPVRPPPLSIWKILIPPTFFTWFLHFVQFYSWNLKLFFFEHVWYTDGSKKLDLKKIRKNSGKKIQKCCSSVNKVIFINFKIEFFIKKCEIFFALFLNICESWKVIFASKLVVFSVKERLKTGPKIDQALLVSIQWEIKIRKLSKSFNTKCQNHNILTTYLVIKSPNGLKVLQQCD